MTIRHLRHACIILLTCACARQPAHAQVRTQAPDSAELAQRLDLMIKDDTLRQQIELRADRIVMYASVEDRIAGKPEHIVPMDQVHAFVAAAKAKAQLQPITPTEKWSHPQRNFQQPLLGYRIALDPGHVGGTMEFGKLEWKFVRIKRNPEKGIPEDIAFNEGNLALGTALLLDSMLRAAGAEVLITRQGEGMTAFGYDFETWLDTMQVRFERLHERAHQLRDSFPDEREWNKYRYGCAGRWYILQTEAAWRDRMFWMGMADRTAIYKGPFLRAEFQERARKVNAFQPDLTLILHYNVLETNEPGKGGYRDAVRDNVCMAFVPGAFMAGELSTPEDRLDFLIHWLGDDLPASLRLSEEVMAAHEKLLGVPRLLSDTTLGYIVRASLPTPAPAVYARNLALTRQMHGVMCFGESLYQDNLQECVRLNEKRLVLPGMTTRLPTRIREVALAYYEGVLNYVLQQ
jgi:N-acetylmuramoyl-L-alanine amidase